MIVMQLQKSHFTLLHKSASTAIHITPGRPEDAQPQTLAGGSCVALDEATVFPEGSDKQNAAAMNDHLTMRIYFLHCIQPHLIECI